MNTKRGEFVLLAGISTTSTQYILSEHYAVHCQLDLCKAPFERKEITYRKVKATEMVSLRSELANPDLINTTRSNVTSLIERFESTLSKLLNAYALVKRGTVTIRPYAPWYNDSINKQEKTREKVK